MKETHIKRLENVKSYMGNFFSKLSRGLMLPIALLPVAGLFLGVGAGIENTILVIGGNNNWDQSLIDGLIFVPDAISKIGDVIFGNLPTLFCLGVALAFSEEAGVAVFAAFVGWVVFNATQSTFIWENTVPVYDIDGVTQIGTSVSSYDIGWYNEVPTSVVTSNVGITSMQTSVFGGITIGLFVAYLYNKFHTIQLPNVIGFFSGSRFVPIITFLTVPLWGLGFVAIWPIFGIGLDWFGQQLLGLPGGIDAFIFGVVERSLIPFGLHHAFYAPLWYTSAGGQLVAVSQEAADSLGIGLNQSVGGDQGVWFAFQTLGIPYGILNHVSDTGQIDYTITNGAGVWAAVDNVDGYDGFTVIYKDGNPFATVTQGMDPGQYQQGKYPFMIFGLPAAGAAMIMASKKENRQVAMSVIGAAAITSFLTGITEPIEFTFLFLAPVLYYGFHVWMAGLSFMLLNVLGSHIGMTFSGGIIDYFLFGLLPSWTGFHTNPYWVIAIGLAYIPIYYFAFYFYIVKFDVKTPGRDDGEIAMITKADYKAAKGKTETKSSSKTKKGSSYLNDPKWIKRADDLLKKLGGMDNLKSIAACITRLRVTVVDPSKVDYAGIKAMGASGIVGEGKTSQQHIFGSEADRFKIYFLSLREKKK